MRIVDIEAAKADLSRLIELAAAGEPFMIARDGKPLVRVDPVDGPPASRPRIGFMKGRLKVPENFDDLGRDKIIVDFEGRSCHEARRPAAPPQRRRARRSRRRRRRPAREEGEAGKVGPEDRGIGSRTGPGLPT